MTDCSGSVSCVGVCVARAKALLGLTFAGLSLLVCAPWREAVVGAVVRLAQFAGAGPPAFGV